MKYQFKSGIDKKEYDKFVKNFSSTSFMQTSSWAEIKTAWDCDFLGMYSGKKILCAAMILKRNLFFGKKIGYIPRGMVIDYKDKELLTEFVNSIKKYAKENKIIDIKIDPFICFNESHIQTIKNGKKIEIPQNFSKDTLNITNNLTELGFKHGGYKKEVSAYIQPRYTMAIALKDSSGCFLEPEELRRTFPKNTRNYIGTYQEERGVEFNYSKDPNDVKDLIKVLQCTEKRQHISLRNENYFKSIMNKFPENAVLFFARVNIDKYVKFLKEDMKKNTNKVEFCNKQILEAKKVKDKYGNKPIVGATIVMLPICSKGTKVASFLYAGTNTEILPTLKVTNGLMFYRLSYCLDHKCDYCDLGGVDGSLKDHLSIFKSKFNPIVLELVGEYDLIISKLYFKIFKISIHTLKTLKSILKK